MSNWQPITRPTLNELLEEDRRCLSVEETLVFERGRVEPWHATLRRTKVAGDEPVFVVWQCRDWVIYFDDVEWGFEFSPIDPLHRILNASCNQGGLQSAVYLAMKVQP